MVGGDIAQVRHVAAEEPLVRIVVVEVRHPLPGAAPELADVVPRGAAGDQGQVDGHPRPLEVPRHAQSRVVDPGDVLQGAPGGGLQPQAHHLVDVLPPVGAQELPVALPVLAALQLLLVQELQLPHGVRREAGALLVQQDLEEG